MEELVQVIAKIIAIVVTVCFSYQAFYVLVGLVVKPKKYKAKTKHRYAVIISARNESMVIEKLIESIKSQSYDQELVDTIVIADNCNDNTAQVAKNAGAIVYERANNIRVGKGYALDYGFKQIEKEKGLDYYDGYFVIDADNILEEDYIEQMNHVFDNGYRVVTSYRNSKNFSANWISFAYGLWFLREAKFVNNARMILGTSCAVSGTGFLVSNEIIKKNHGWKHHLLTEDIEFSVDNMVHGEKIGYCGDAILYDEQPEDMVSSWHQRMRWSRGFYQVFYYYGRQLFSRCIRKRDFSCYDMFITLVPGIGLGFITILLSVLSLYFGVFHIKSAIILCAKSVGNSIITSYGTFFLLGLVTLLSEWKRIRCKWYKSILYLMLFPIFMFTYIPISFVALFHTPEWKPILHTVSITRKEIHESQG